MADDEKSKKLKELFGDSDDENDSDLDDVKNISDDDDEEEQGEKAASSKKRKQRALSDDDDDDDDDVRSTKEDGEDEEGAARRSDDDGNAKEPEDEDEERRLNDGGESEEAHSKPESDDEGGNESESYGVDAASLPSFKKKKVEGISNEKESRPHKKSKKRRRDRDAAAAADSQEEAEQAPLKPLDPAQARRLEVKRDIEEALQRIKPKRMKKKDLQDEAEIDEMMTVLVSKMKEAAEKDHEFNKLKQPAIAKLILLPSVMEQLTRSQWWDAFLDNHVLEGIKTWLEPLSDASLPALDIQRAMFKTLSEMPIRTEHLRESGVGKIVMFYSKCARVIPELQKLVRELLDKWMRPIMKRSDNYRDRVVQKVDYNPNRRESEDYANDAEAEQIASRGGGGGGGSRAMNRTSGVDKFVRVPVPVPAAFDYAPQSNVIGGEARRMPDQMRKMQNKMRNKKK